MIDRDRLKNAYASARDALFAERGPDGFWVGELSSSALATATAIAALKIASPNDRLIDNGLRWLAEHQNADGGWGDTVKSFSNISTTMLCRAAIHMCGPSTDERGPIQRCEAWLAQNYGKTSAELAESVRKRYGKDRTFAVPILTMCAIAGLVEWNEVPRLPFELACLPQSWYRFARLPVVSYALPALIAIGQCIHHHRGTWNPLTALARWFAKSRSLRVLERIQPSSGGYLEATPLTSFVVMSLAAMTHNSPSKNRSLTRVIDKGIEFIVQSARDDGSWPIDSNLSIWVTTLAVNALAAAGDLETLDRRDELRQWLVAQQMVERHPYTGADPGGWGWSHLPGSVPDCDDTPGAVLAISALAESIPNAAESPEIPRALTWIADLQNNNGGWPTFCRGWGALPFDRSGSDLTAHALRAIASQIPAVEDAWKKHLLYIEQATKRGIRLRLVARLDPERLKRACRAGFQFLSRQQRPDGSWLPLWFGNQQAPEDTNPTYGSAKVLMAYRDHDRWQSAEAQRGVAFLLSIQNADGGWGGAKDVPSSVEETALVVEALCDRRLTHVADALDRAAEYLMSRVEDGSFRDSSPIGFYFAKLWYFEKLYPIIFTVAALGLALKELPSPEPIWSDSH